MMPAATCRAIPNALGARALHTALKLASEWPCYGESLGRLSTRRQFQRYGQWYARLCAQPPDWQGPLLAIAQAVLAELPAVYDAEWDYARG